MKAIARRVRNIENKLYVGKAQPEPLVVVTLAGREKELPEPLQEWITYKQAKAEADSGQFSIFIADPDKELEARKVLQNPER